MGVPLVLTVAVVSLSRRSVHADLPADATSIAKLGPAAAAAAAAAPPPPTLAGLDATKMVVTDDGVHAPLADKRVAHLTVEPGLQKIASEILAAHHLPEAAIVLMDISSGRILVYASHVEKGPPKDLCLEATAPAASVFKIITATALVEHANLTPEERTCYSGGEQRIYEKDLEPNPRRDKWCATLAGAMGRSLNTVFARLASQHLKPPQLLETAQHLGFGTPLPFDIAPQASTITVPDDTLGFARTAAGFWNTTLSPLHAAWLSATVARGGEPVRPVLVADVSEEGSSKPMWTAPTGLAQKHAMKEATAQAITTMMESTVSDGTSYRAFHDGKGRAFLPGVSVAGKTGTLTDASTQRYYTWFTGFAPSKPVTMPDGQKEPPKVAVAVLVVNGPQWSVKANVVAREMLRAYFAEEKVPSVTSPTPHAIEHHEDRPPETADRPLHSGVRAARAR
ncbi:MAG TPA: penicillin-binding transpeptidase domain-containing protein [Labilithrix sp.]